MPGAGSRAEEYRQTAERLRSLARKTCFPESGRQLIALAASFDALADRVEDWSEITVKGAATD